MSPTTSCKSAVSTQEVCSRNIWCHSTPCLADSMHLPSPCKAAHSYVTACVQSTAQFRLSMQRLSCSNQLQSTQLHNRQKCQPCTFRAVQHNSPGPQVYSGLAWPQPQRLTRPEHVLSRGTAETPGEDCSTNTHVIGNIWEPGATCRPLCCNK